MLCDYPFIFDGVVFSSTFSYADITLKVTSNADTKNISLLTDTVRTLRDAILIGNASSEQVITIDLSGLAGQTITLSNALPIISNYRSNIKLGIS